MRKSRNGKPAHLMKGQHVKIRHTKNEGWSMTIGGRQIPQVRAVAVKFSVGNVDTVAVEFYPGGVSIDTDDANVALVPVEIPQPSLRERVVERWKRGW